MLAKFRAALTAAVIVAVPVMVPAPTSWAQKAPESMTPKFVAHASMTDLFEVEAGKLAIEKARSSDVKTFAKRMMDDHGKVTADLKNAVQSSDPGVPLTTKLDQPHQQMIEELQKAQGDEFDRLYMSFQVKGHQQAIALYQAYDQSGDQPGLKALVKDVLPMIQAHLDDAKKLADTIQR
jgi:putative membrane protein